jgi:hypothetical protein
MYRSVVPSLTVVSLVVSLALIAVPGGAQQPAPTTPPQVQPMVVQPQDCPKFIAEITRLTNVRFDPAAASAKQTAAEATTQQADGKYAECVTTARAALASLGLMR